MRQLVLTFSLAAFFLISFAALYSDGIVKIQSVSAQDYIDAADESDDIDPSATGGLDDSTGGPGGGSTGGKLVNPLQSQSITEFLVKIIDVLLIFAVPIIILFIMYAGFLYVTARGDTSQISRAHSALTWSVVGGVVALGAKLIITVIQGTIVNF